MSDPIIAFILPKELEFADNISISYSDYFKDSNVPKLPPYTIITDINENGDSIIKFEFTDEYSFDFRQKSTLKISFDTKVKVGAYGSFETYMILNTLDASQVINETSEIYRDELNIANNSNVSIIYAKSSTKENLILFFVSTKSDLKVKGSLDTEFIEEPLIGNTTSGGNLEYQITVTNIGNVELEKIEILDILPYIGDTGVISINQSRNSDFETYLLNDISVNLIKEDGEKIQSNFDIYYSTSKNPLRFGPVFNLIGIDDNWITDLPDELDKVKSFKVITKDIQLFPNESLEITFLASAPSFTPINSVAWNSFAIDTSYLDLNGNLTHMLAIEPEKVGIMVNTIPDDKGEIRGFTWFDDNKDSSFSNLEKGINNIGVVLLNENNIIIDYTFTTPDFNR